MQQNPKRSHFPHEGFLPNNLSIPPALLSTGLQFPGQDRYKARRMVPRWLFLGLSWNRSAKKTNSWEISHDLNFHGLCPDAPFMVIHGPLWGLYRAALTKCCCSRAQKIQMRHNYCSGEDHVTYCIRGTGIPVSHPARAARCRCPSLGLCAGHSPRSKTTQNPPAPPRWSSGRRFDSSPRRSAWVTFVWAASLALFWTTEPRTWGIRLWNDSGGLQFHPSWHWGTEGTV